MARLFFLGGKRASQFRADAKRRKEIRRDASTVDDLCAFAIRLGEEPRHFLVGGDGLEGVVLTLPIEEVGIGSLEGPARLGFVSGRARGKLDGVDRDQAFVIGKRQGAQENSVDQGEDGCGSSYSESQSDDRRHGESGAAAELAEGELRVGDERGEHGGIMAGQTLWGKDSLVTSAEKASTRTPFPLARSKFHSRKDSERWDNPRAHAPFRFAQGR